MTFLTEHFFIFLGAILFGIFLYTTYRILTQPSSSNSVFWTKVERLRNWEKPFWILLVLAFGSLVLWAYLLPVFYYFPRNPGVTGDNYLYLTAAFENSNYFTPFHLLFPVLGVGLVRLVILLGWLDPNSATFYEDAVQWSAYPSKLIGVSALLGFVWALYSISKNRFGATIGALLVATSYGYWLWAPHANSLIMALAFELWSISFLILWITHRQRKFLWALSASLGVALCAHVTCLFMVFGFLIVVPWFIYRYCNEIPKRSDLFRDLGAFLGPQFLGLAILGVAQALKLYDTIIGLRTSYLENRTLYLTKLDNAVTVYHELMQKAASNDSAIAIAFNPYSTFHGLASTGDQSNWEFSLTHLMKAIPINISTNLLYFFNIWRPSSTFDTVLIFLEIALATALILIAVKNRLKLPMARVFLYLLAPSWLVAFLVFMVFRTGSHYIVISVISLWAIFLIQLMSTDFKQRVVTQILMLALCFCFFLFNGFSSQNLRVAGRTLDEDRYYRFASGVHPRISSAHQGCLMTEVTNDYAEDAVEAYYKKKFKNIRWITADSNWKDSKSLTQSLSEAKLSGCQVFVAGKPAELIAQSKELKREFSLQEIDSEVFQVNRMTD